MLVLLGSLSVVTISLCGAAWIHAEAAAQAALQQSEAQAQQVIAQAREQADAKKLAAETQLADQLAKECQKGAADYNLLTPFEKAKAVMPNCSLVLQ